MGRSDQHVNIATGLKIALDRDLDRITGRNQVIEDLIHRFLVGNVFVPVAIDIQLNRLEFDDAFIRDIGDMQGGKVGIAGKGTFAGEFRQGNRNFIASSGAGIGEGNQLAFGL
jgi:hypothetical protein